MKFLITELITRSLDNAEKTWESGGYKLVQVLESARMAALEYAEIAPSHIPGHPLVSDQETVIDEFVALVADMRGSSRHLMCAISPKIAQVSGLQRVYYETSALLPALSKTISYKDGSVTEYLGDGVLALFQVDENDKSKAIYSAYNSAKEIIGSTRMLINTILEKRYSLPPLNIGVGLALSKTIVTLVGLDGKKQPKAFGECVFRATKLSTGFNEIFSDINIKLAWPKSKGGKIVFKLKNFEGVEGYLIDNENN